MAAPTRPIEFAIEAHILYHSLQSLHPWENEHGAAAVALALGSQVGLERPDVEFNIFQFPADRIPRIDGETNDWSIVPDSYTIGMDQLRETVAGIGDQRDPANLNV